MSMNNIGKPINNEKRQRANDMLKEVGVEKALFRWDCVQQVSEQLERDNPHIAMDKAMQYVDITGAYRLFAELLVDIGENK